MSGEPLTAEQSLTWLRGVGRGDWWSHQSEAARAVLAEYDRRGAELERLRRDRDALMAGLLAALLPNLDAETADRVGKEIRRLGGVG